MAAAPIGPDDGQAHTPRGSEDWRKMVDSWARPGGAMKALGGLAAYHLNAPSGLLAASIFRHLV